MSNENIKELRSKILEGLELAYQKLIISKAKEDKELIFSENGKIIKVRAKELVPKVLNK